jgi:hypothetical protein
METCPKIASTRLPVEGCRPPRLAIETNKRPTGGLIAPMALLALILFGVAPLFTLPSVSHRDLVRLVRTFLQGAARSECASGSLFDDCFRPFTRPHPAGMSREDIRQLCGGQESRTCGKIPPTKGTDSAVP